MMGFFAKKNCILDLDNTLMYTHQDPRLLYDDSFEVKNSITNDVKTYYLIRRPFYKEFLDCVFQKFNNVGVWTASTPEYANRVIDLLFTKEQKQKLCFLFTRENCQFVNDKYIKLSSYIFNNPVLIKKGFLPDNTLLIDNELFYFPLQIKIKDFSPKTQEYDSELNTICDIIKRTDNIRTIIQTYI